MTDVQPQLRGTRAEHLAACKQRAIAEYDAAGGGAEGARIGIASMTSDLSKHPETADHDGVMLGMMELMTGSLNSRERFVYHIEGYG